MEQTWIVVANASDAHIYSQKSKGDALELVETLNHPESRMKGSELASDGPGHQQSKGTGHGTMAEPTSPKDYEHERFAKEIADALDAGRTANSYHKLIVVAAPHFHGLLNKAMDEQVGKLVVENIEKDYTDSNAATLKEQLGL